MLKNNSKNFTPFFSKICNLCPTKDDWLLVYCCSLLGYIPSGNQFFGERFAVLIKRAKEQQKANSRKCSSDVCCRKKWLKFDLANIKSRHFSTPGSNGPLKPIVEKAPMFYGKGVRPSARPCAMRRDNPDKHYISGYTGFVPRARKYMGKDFVNKLGSSVSSNMWHLTGLILILLSFLQ